MASSPVHIVWKGMIARCTNRNDPKYADYGGRGIKVCKRWRRFEYFYADMGDRPKGMTLDRVDNAKGYSPGNCRWATLKEQGNNRRSTLKIERKGEVKSLKEWCEFEGLPYKTVHRRININDWDLERALTTPLGPGWKTYRARRAKP